MVYQTEFSPWPRLANRCSICGLERPAIAPEGSCPRCLLETRAPEKVDTPAQLTSMPPTAPDAASSGDSPGSLCAPADFDATGAAHALRLGAEATTALANATGSGIPGRRFHPPSPPMATGPCGDSVSAVRPSAVSATTNFSCREIARAGWGSFFKAPASQTSNRPVALKMIPRRQPREGEAEIQPLLPGGRGRRQPRSPRYCQPIFEVGQHQDQHYFSMGFVEGQSLAQKVIDGPLPPRVAADLTFKIAEAVQYAHEMGVIHRDLKPSNVLLDAHGHPKVTDFGLAKKLRSDSALTASGQIMGTPSYMPPGAGGGTAVGSASGPWPTCIRWAAILSVLCLLTGRPPFQAANVMETLKQVLEQDPPAPRTLNAAIPSVPGDDRAEMPAERNRTAVTPRRGSSPRI